MRYLTVFAILIALVIQTNCQLDEGDFIDEEDGKSFGGNIEEGPESKPNKKLDDLEGNNKKVNKGSDPSNDKLKETEEIRPRSQFTEERFSQLFVPRNSRRKLASPRYTVKPKPTLPSFIKKPPSVKPPEFEAPPSRNFVTQSSRNSRTTTTTTPRPSSGRGNRGRVTQAPSRIDATSSTTESYRRNFYSTRRPSNRLFPGRGRV